METRRLSAKSSNSFLTVSLTDLNTSAKSSNSFLTVSLTDLNTPTTDLFQRLEEKFTFISVELLTQNLIFHVKKFFPLMEIVYKVFYGSEIDFRDVTSVIIEKCKKNNDFACIPSSDNGRAAIFGDHLPGVLKRVELVSVSGEKKQFYSGTPLLLRFCPPNSLLLSATLPRKKYWYNSSIMDPREKLAHIHDYLEFEGGDIKDELPEQLMAVEYLNPNASVLELGANYGRNTLTIATILNDDSKLVTMETDPQNAQILENNKKKNGYNFQIEVSALSNRRLIQKGWETVPLNEDIVPTGYFETKTIAFDALQSKHNVVFDTIVLDCEGAFYYILQDFPNLLQNINTILMENDYHDMRHKLFVDDVLRKNSFKPVCSRGGGWGPCCDFFFQVWKK